jgi:signal transduction histidine kinase
MDDEHLQQINQEIYKRNLELAIVNKTLSLLRKLYQISLLTLSPADLAPKISETVRIDLNMETVGIYYFDEPNDTIIPFIFSKADKLKEIAGELNFLLKDFHINVSNSPIFKEVVYGKVSAMTKDLNDVWGGIMPQDKLDKLVSDSGLKTVMLYPLISQDKVIGVLLLGLNREYALLNENEKDSIKSIIDVIAVALDKAYLYKELQDANEKLKGLDKLKTEFLSLASHQLRSPLTAIKGYTSMLLDGDFGEINPKAREAIDRVFQSSNNLVVVVEDLLNVSKIESGGMKYTMEPFNLIEISKSTTEDLSITAAKRGLKMTFESNDGEDCTVNGDKEKLRQVVLNFIDNSIKYTKEGTIVVSVKRDSDKVVFAVKDTGMGMTPEIKASLFQKFARGEGARMNTSGSGLGLYLAKEIVEAHKGTVNVDSDGPGKGSVFSMTLDAIK